MSFIENFTSKLDDNAKKLKKGDKVSVFPSLPLYDVQKIPHDWLETYKIVFFFNLQNWLEPYKKSTVAYLVCHTENKVVLPDDIVKYKQNK